MLGFSNRSACSCVKSVYHVYVNCRQLYIHVDGTRSIRIMNYNTVPRISGTDLRSFLSSFHPLYIVSAELITPISFSFLPLYRSNFVCKRVCLVVIHTHTHTPYTHHTYAVCVVRINRETYETNVPGYLYINIIMYKHRATTVFIMHRDTACACISMQPK